MTTEAEATIQVATIDLRRAFQAVAPHAEKNKTGDNAVEHRIRMCFADGEVYVMATNGATVGLAVVPIHEDSRAERFAPDDGSFWVDLTPRHLKLMLQHFSLSTGSGADMDEMLEWRVTTGEVTVKDVGGLWTGESVTFQQVDADSSYPDIIGALAPALAMRSSAPSSKPLVAAGSLIRLFQAASDAYDSPVEFYSTGSESARGFVVQVGSRFVGTVESRHLDDDGMKRRQSAYTKWLERFPAPQLKAVSG